MPNRDLSALPKSNLAIRFLTAGIGGPVILGILYFGPLWAWFTFIALAAAVGSFEFFGMTHRGDRVAQTLCATLVIGVIAVLYRWGMDAKAVLSLLVLLPLAAILVVLVRLGDITTATLRVAATVFGPLYLGGGLGSLVLLRRDAGADGPGFVVLTLMLAWLSDTGAYFAGRFLGKHKLYEAVSPKKTVEGALGGILGGIGGALLGCFFYLRSLPLIDGIVLAVVGGGLGQVGDLGESLIKRSVGVKDSGGIVPGHGGILYRVDALLVTATITYLYLLWARP